MSTKVISYEGIIAVESLFGAWERFQLGKKKRKDVQIFNYHLEDNIFDLHTSLKKSTYTHDKYIPFYVNDPKQRHIHKATVKDRLVHQAIYSALYPIFDPTFIFDSYSCRNDKGTHKAIQRLQVFLKKSSKNYSQNTYVLKCDINKFFASVDKDILLSIIIKTIQDGKTILLIKEVLDSFPQGLPLGNLTSQLFANVYLNELDQYIKHDLRIKHYIRYCDDFIIVNQDKEFLLSLIVKIEGFLWHRLKLQLHPRKVILRKFSWGIDFLGYVVLPHYILPRTKTKKRLFHKLDRKMEELTRDYISYDSFNQSFQSYLGYLKHANSFKLKQRLRNHLYFLYSNISSKSSQI